jgi:hypothetical protein
MSFQSTIFNQLLHFIPRYDFDKAVKEQKSDNYCKKFTSWEQLLVLFYTQVTLKDSLRDIETGLLSHRHNLYHLGMEPIPRSTLSDAMNRRNPIIFETIFYNLLDRVHKLAPFHKFRFKNPLYSIDSTTIDLCLSVFNWAKFRKRKGAIKLHYKLSHQGHLPVFCALTNGKVHDVKAARKYLPVEPDSITCMDRGYLDFQWLYSLHQQGAYFVTRAKDNMNFKIIGQHQPVKNKHILRDDLILLEGFYTSQKYSEPIRLIEYKDPETGKIYVFLTNHFDLAAITIAEIYHQRWQIELFFKWIKQNLKIKTFLGTSKNAVMAQVWTAMIYYLLLAYLKFQSKCTSTLTELSRRFQNTLMDRLSILEVLSLTKKALMTLQDGLIPKQLVLFPI